MYEKDTALQADGRTRVLGFSKKVGRGEVVYIALGHCHSASNNVQPFVDESLAEVFVSEADGVRVVLIGSEGQRRTIRP